METMRTSVVSNRRTSVSNSPTRFSRNTLNCRILGQSRPRDVDRSIPDLEAELMDGSWDWLEYIGRLVGWSTNRQAFPAAFWRFEANSSGWANQATKN